MNKNSGMLKTGNGLWVIIWVAFLARLISLNQSLWLDEGTTAQAALHYSIPDIITKFSPQDFHPPLFYVLEKIWTAAFGYSEIALRMPSVLFSLLTGWMVFLIGKTVKDEKTGLWAAVFFLFNPLIMYYSQEARMYMMVLFFLSVALYCFTALQHKSHDQTTENWLYAGLFVASFLSFVTFYGSAFFLAALLLYAVWKKQVTEAGFIFFGFLFGIIAVAPLLLAQLRNSQIVLVQVANWKATLGTVTFENLVLVPIKFATGRISFFPKYVYFGIATVWSAFIYFFAIKGAFKHKLLLFMVSVPLLIGVLFSFFTPLLEYFRFLYLIIPLSVLFALGANKTWARWVIFTGFAIWSFAYLLIPQFHRENWKELGFKETARKIYAVPSSMEALKYYRPDIQIQEIRTVDFKEDKIVVIPYTTEIYGYDYKTVLSQHGYINKDSAMYKTDYNGVHSELWEKL